MSVKNADYTVKIVTEADEKGVKQVTADFQELGKEIPKSGESLHDLGKEHEEAGKKGEEAGKKQSHAAHEAALSHHELLESVRAVARQFGGMADVGMWLSPATAGLAAMLAAVEAIKHVFEELKQPVDAANEALRAIDDAKLKAAAESANSLSSALSDIANEEERLDAAYREGDAAIDARIKKYADEQEAILKLIEAKEKLREAEIEAQVRTGAISKEQGDAAKEAARLELDQARGATDQAKLKFEIDQRTAQLKEAQQRLNSGADVRAIVSNQGDIDYAHKNLAIAEANQKSVEEGSINVDGKNFKNRGELAKRQQEVDEKLQDLIGQGADLSKPAKKGDAINEEAAYYAKEKSALDEAIRSHDSYVANLAKETEIAKEAEGAAKSRVETSKDRLKHDEELNRAAPDQIKTLQDTYNLHQQSNASIQAINRQAADIRTGGALSGHAPGNANQPAPSEQNIGALLQSAQYAERLIGQQRGGMEANQGPQVHEILRRIINLLENPHLPSQFKDEFAEHERRLEILEHRSNQSGNVSF